MPTIEGVDSRGRPYKFVDGKRVATSEVEAPKYKPTRDDLQQKIQSAVDDVRRIHGSADIDRLLNSTFHNLLSTTAKTSVGRYGQLYAARFILALLRDHGADEPLDEDDPVVKQVMDQHGGVDHKKLKAVVEDAVKPQASRDEEFLGIIHAWGGSPTDLRAVLSGK